MFSLNSEQNSNCYIKNSRYMYLTGAEMSIFFLHCFVLFHSQHASHHDTSGYFPTILSQHVCYLTAYFILFSYVKFDEAKLSNCQSEQLLRA